jgi:hypothetical protein
MAHDKDNPSLPRRSFCAGTFGLMALGPLGLAGCGAGADGASSSGQGAPRLLADSTGAFVHPGLLHTQADFDRISAKIQN